MNEPIFALATSIQRSALHLHRVSGQGIFEKIIPYLSFGGLTMSSRGLTAGSSLEKIQFPFTRYVHIFDEHNSLIDDVVVTFFRAPKSFTGEDLIEISCHGNPLISQKLHSFFRFLGFRDALSGEFTQRAFLNGKLDLAQAEAICELIHAETYAGVELSRNQLNGELSKEIEFLRDKFTNILSYLEAHIDFAPDEVGNYEPHVLLPKLEEIFDRLMILKNSYANGIKLKEGVKIVLCGLPNAGKSTLYNKLLNADRAIVTEIAGTTRDVLSERLVIEKRDFVLMDTAGLRETKNVVEKLGVERSKKALEEADIICTVIDGTKSRLDSVINPIGDMVSPRGLTAGSRNIFVVSKSDLITNNKKEKILSELKKHLHENQIVFTSKDDISQLKQKLIEMYDEIFSKSKNNSSSPILISERAHDKVKLSLNILEEVFELVKKNDLPEKIASSLYCALKELEEILGEVDMENIYNKIFSSFCIGK